MQGGEQEEGRPQITPVIILLSSYRRTWVHYWQEHHSTDWERPPGKVRAVVGMCGRTHPKPPALREGPSQQDPTHGAAPGELHHQVSGWVWQAGWFVPRAGCGAGVVRGEHQVYWNSQHKKSWELSPVGIPLRAAGMCWTVRSKSDLCVGTIVPMCNHSKIPTNVYRNKLHILGLAFSPCEMLPEQVCAFHFFSGLAVKYLWPLTLNFRVFIWTHMISFHFILRLKSGSWGCFSWLPAVTNSYQLFHGCSCTQGSDLMSHPEPWVLMHP